MPPETRHGFCLVHGPHLNAVCPACVDQLADMFMSTVQQSLHNEIASLGRWETPTEFDREFLAEMRISSK